MTNLKIVLFILLFLSNCATDPALETKSATIVVSKVQPVTNKPADAREFFVEIDEVIEGPEFGCCLLIYDTEYQTTFPKGWSNMYSGRIVFKIENKHGKWSVIKQN